jgi:Zn-dependent protease
MGIIGAAGLFISIIVHEFSHSLVAQRFGMHMKGITLFIFGGVAEMGDEPPSPRAEFLMAAVGPLSSIVLAFFFYGLFAIGQQMELSDGIQGVLGYLGAINGILALFNLVPAFPLDGGRILRSLIWGAKNDLDQATRISSKIGSGFAFVLMGWGIFQVLAGNFVGGMWAFLIGMFLRTAARMSYQKLVMRRNLEGEPIRRFMKSDPVTVRPLTTLEDFVKDYVYKYHHKMFPVVGDEGRLKGCITTKQVGNIPKEEWPITLVSELAQVCSRENTATSDLDATEALARMNRSGASRLMVVEGNRLVGIIALKDMLRFLALKIELEGR